MVGIEELKEALKFVIELGNGLGESLKDGKFGFGDLMNFVPAIIALPAAFGGIDEIPGELNDLDEAERLELIEFVRSELDIEQDKAEAIAEQSFLVLTEIFKLVQLIV